MVSIIIPVYNAKIEYFHECMRSVLGQTYTDIEAVLVDDGATEELRHACEEYAERDSRVLVIHQENAGAAAARNAGLKACQGEYVTFVDSDDYIDTKTIELALKRLLEDDLQILLWGSYKFDESGKKEYMPYDADVRLFEGELKEQLQLKTMAGYLSFYLPPSTHFGSGSCCSKLYKKAFLEEKKLWYPLGIKRAEDVNFNIRAFENAGRIGYLNQHFYYYRQHSDSATYQYRENGIEVFTDALNCLKSFLEEYDKGDIFYQIYYQRCLFFFLESMDMDYLNKNNKKPLKLRIREMKAAALSEPYCSAVQRLDFKYLSMAKRIPVILIKYGMMRTLCLFYSLYRRMS